MTEADAEAAGGRASERQGGETAFTRCSNTSRAIRSLVLLCFCFTKLLSTMEFCAKLPGKEIEQQFVFLSSDVDGCNDGAGKRQISIKLFVDMNVGIGGDIWPAANLFCSWMTIPAYAGFFNTIFNSSKILELGSGNGLVSILVEKAFTAQIIVVSDLLSHLNLIEHNLAMNACEICKPIAVDWVDEKPVIDEKFDVILALECLYREFLYESLIQTMLRYGHENSIMILGVTRAFVKPSFFQLLQKYNLSYRKVPESVLSQHMIYDPSIGLFIVKTRI